MAVTNVNPREIVEVAFQMPDGEILIHPALVLSGKQLQLEEDGMFYAVLISSKNIHKNYTISIEDVWLSKPFKKQSYFVTHIVSYFMLKDVTARYNNYIREDKFYFVLSKILENIYDLDVSL